MNICRTRFKKDIITEFLPPRNKKSQKVMIFCSGLPGTPCKDDVLDFWSRKGYWTFFPRYRGAWESGGVFLKESLEQDVFDVIEAMSEQFMDYWSGKKYRVKPKSVTVVGSSFGGPAAILATQDPRVDKAICISPVVDWVAEHKAESLDLLYDFVKEAYGGAYRLNKQYWNKLARGNFYNPVKHIDSIDGNKVLIFHAKDDKVVRYKPVANFAKKTKSHIVVLNKGGHLSSSMLMKKKYFRRVKNFLLSK